MVEVGFTFSLGNISGISSAKVKSLEAGVSTITGTATISDPILLPIAKNIPSLTVKGNNINLTHEYRITDEGIQNVLDDDNFTLVKYDVWLELNINISLNGRKLEEKLNTNLLMMTMDKVL